MGGGRNSQIKLNSPSPNHSSDVEMVDLDREVDMKWDNTITITPEQAIRLILMKEKAIRIRKSRLQRQVLLEGLLRY